MRLAQDEAVALRHVLAYVTASDGSGHPRLRLFDLNTGLGMGVAGHGACTAVVTDGDAMVTVGSYQIVFLAVPKDAPALADDAARAWAERPHAATGDYRSRPIGAALRALDQPASNDTSVTLIAGPSVIAQARALRLLADCRSAATLAIGQSDTGFGLALDDLDRGILMGRYERCAVNDFSAQSVSRVHLLLVRESGHVLAIDTASTYGTMIDGIGRAVAELKSRSVIRLGLEAVVTWEKRD